MKKIDWLDTITKEDFKFSASSLKLALTNPVLFYHKYILKKKIDPTASQEIFDIGSLYHGLLLEPSKINSRIIIKVATGATKEDYINFFKQKNIIKLKGVSELIKKIDSLKLIDIKKEYNQILNDDLISRNFILLTKNKIDLIKKQVEFLSTNTIYGLGNNISTFKKLVTHNNVKKNIVICEKSFKGKIDISKYIGGKSCKVNFMIIPDLLIKEKGNNKFICIDIKTTANTKYIDKTIFDFSYEVQAYCYINFFKENECFVEIEGNKVRILLDEKSFFFYFIDKSEVNNELNPYSQIPLFQLDTECYSLAKKEIITALGNVKAQIENPVFTNMGKNKKEITPPVWIKRKVTERVNSF